MQPVQRPPEPVRHLGLWIDDQERPALDGRTFDTPDPATGAVLATLARGDRADVDLAVAAAKRAQDAPIAGSLGCGLPDLAARAACLRAQPADLVAAATPAPWGTPGIFGWPSSGLPAPGVGGVDGGLQGARRSGAGGRVPWGGVVGGWVGADVHCRVGWGSRFPAHSSRRRGRVHAAAGHAHAPTPTR